MVNTRELAVDILLAIEENNRYSHLVIRDVLEKYNYLEGRDKAFVKRLSEGVLERRIQLDYILDQFSKVKAAKMKPLIRSLLRVSLYQLLFMDGVPDAAVCSEAVKLAGKRGFRTLQGFVNGVLRNIIRNREGIRYPDREREPLLYLSVQYSMPEWLAEHFLSAYSFEETENLLKAFQQTYPVTVRLKESLSKEEKESWLKQLSEKGVRVSPHPYLPYAFRLEGTEDIRRLPGYDRGFFMVQDVSSMLVCEAAGLRKNQRIIDVCAAPGGKALHSAEKLKGTGLVSARDLTEQKTALISLNRERMRLSNLEVFPWDARLFRKEDVEAADVVLADLPCSGLGIMGKKKDIRYHADKEGLSSLARLQREILSVVWQYVKPGGVLLYSTCTINREENEENVNWFTAHYPFEKESLSPYLPKALKEEGTDGCLQLLPGVHETDGFFLARLKRKK